MRNSMLIVVAAMFMAAGSALAASPGALLKPFGGDKGQDNVQVQVALTDMNQIKGYGFSVSFDPAQYEFVRAEQGADNLLGSASPLFLISTKEPGRVMVANANVGKTGISGSGSGAVLTFRKIGNAIGQFQLSSLQVLDASGSVTVIKNVEALDLKPRDFGMDQNQPNPFNPATQIAYRLPVDGNVRLAIYNILGQQIRALVNGFTPAGVYSAVWDGRDDAGRQVASGVYLYRLDAGKFSTVKRMMLLK
ncbi:MAG: FlgD immunoglobulin-like domain containing protein [Lentisphaerota bacterium]